MVRAVVWLPGGMHDDQQVDSAGFAATGCERIWDWG